MFCLGALGVLGGKSQTDARRFVAGLHLDDDCHRRVEGGFVLPQSRNSAILPS
jgi:hypothetical protein